MHRIIWNGVGLSVPEGWEPAGLERDSLVLEHNALPACELKWRTVQGTFSFDKHLKKITKGNKGVDLHPVADSDTPAAWGASIAALSESGMATRSFIWQAGGHRGMGAALHHPATGLAALIQFFIHREEDEALAAQILATIRDYGSGKTLPFAMFGLTGRVPADFRLDTFAFKPGHYRIRFWRHRKPGHASKLPPGKGPGTRLTFERFAPASVILKGTDLPTWVAENLEDGPGKCDVDATDSHIAWSGAETSLLRSLLRRQHHHAGRAWTTDTNAILAVTATGDAIEPQTLNDITESYGLV